MKKQTGGGGGGEEERYLIEEGKGFSMSALEQEKANTRLQMRH